MFLSRVTRPRSAILCKGMYGRSLSTISRPQKPTVQDIMQLPLMYEESIPASYIDHMGHVNIRHYLIMFDEGEWEILKRWGMDQAYFKGGNGAMDLGHHLRYIKELQVGSQIEVYIRILGLSANKKRFQCMFYMIDHKSPRESEPQLAATMETLMTHASLIERRSTPFPDHVSQQIEAMAERHRKLVWDDMRSGALNV